MQHTQKIHNLFWRNAVISIDCQFRFFLLAKPDFYGGIWYDGEWKDGDWTYGDWLNGKWKNGGIKEGRISPTKTAVSPKSYYKPKQTISLNRAKYF